MTIPTIDAVWAPLVTAPGTRSPFNFLQLATAGLDGAPELRTVVLRGCDPVTGRLTFVTDRRSRKVAEIEREPRVSLLGYDPVGRIQIRIAGEARLTQSRQERLALWETLGGRTLVLFDAPLVPGTVLNANGQPLAAASTGRDDTPFDRFAPVDILVSRIEMLDLTTEPHLRCAYRRRKDGWEGVRSAP